MPNCDVPPPGSRSSTVTLLKLIMSGAGYGFGLGIDTPEAAACEFARHAGGLGADDPYFPWFHSLLQVGSTAIEKAGKGIGSRRGSSVTHAGDQRQYPPKAND